MVIGSATEAPKAPEKPVMWLEDMTDAQLAEATKTPGELRVNSCFALPRGSHISLLFSLNRWSRQRKSKEHIACMQRLT